MNTGLSILLPVYNAQARLAQNVADILDVAPELTPHFDVLIVDDGSTDDTSDVGHELATCYPQVRLVRHPIRLGLGETIQTGLDNTTGEIVFVGDEELGLDPHDLRELWKLRHEKDLIVARHAGSATRANWMEKLLPWRGTRRKDTAHGQARTGLQMIRRSGWEQIHLLDQATDSSTRRLDRSASQRVGQPLGNSYRASLRRFIVGE